MSTPKKVVGQLSLAGLMVALMGCGGASEEQEVTLESTDARLSYGIGLRMGQRMSADGMQIDVAAYAAGLEDAMTGAEAKLSDEEINTEMSAFQERSQAEAEAERVAQAQSNLEAGRAYMEEMSANVTCKPRNRGCNTSSWNPARATIRWLRTLLRCTTRAG